MGVVERGNASPKIWATPTQNPDAPKIPILLPLVGQRSAPAGNLRFVGQSAQVNLADARPSAGV